MSRKTPIDIIEAAEEGKIDVVRKLIQDDPSLRFATTDLAMTPLHRAARFGHVEVVSELLKAGVKPTIRDSRRFTPLHNAACDQESLYCVQLLLEAGCPIDCKNSYGDTPLMQACIYSNLPTVAYLLKCGASVTTKNRRGLDALGQAELQLNGIERRRGSDWRGQMRALNNIIYFIEDAMAKVAS